MFWWKALHFISMVLWFAGIFFVFQALVYHAENRDQPEATALLKLMARRAYRYVATPAMIGTFAFGIGLITTNPAYYFSLGWFHLKLGLLVGLLGYHLFVGWARRRFEADDIRYSPKTCRVLREVWFAFLIAIVLVAVLRPFT